MRTGNTMWGLGVIALASGCAAEAAPVGEASEIGADTLETLDEGNSQDGRPSALLGIS